MSLKRTDSLESASVTAHLMGEPKSTSIFDVCGGLSGACVSQAWAKALWMPPLYKEKFQKLKDKTLKGERKFNLSKDHGISSRGQRWRRRLHTLGLKGLGQGRRDSTPANMRMILLGFGHTETPVFLLACFSDPTAPQPHSVDLTKHLGFHTTPQTAFSCSHLSSPSIPYPLLSSPSILDPSISVASYIHS